ncbi:hypothetical protein JGS22_001840 [Streptomyces sp. P38-E01]|uniref:Uncharacterized protein n=1 Tax=Streptomyces tardus TaxID=2780544 RepID=A0A949JCC7_9ACTN|nr:hypothetical protein [Streptomyces tardus]MBU7596413.1 hypothetical protein [Streptomyces tardus]
MRVEPRFREQISCLVRKVRRAKALDQALSPEDRVAFNDFLVSVVAVLLSPRLGERCGVGELAAFSSEVAHRHRAEGRPVNDFVVEEVLRRVHGVPTLFCSRPVPEYAVSAAGGAVVRYVNNTDPAVATDIDRLLDAAEELHRRRTGR